MREGEGGGAIGGGGGGERIGGCGVVLVGGSGEGEEASVDGVVYLEDVSPVVGLSPYFPDTWALIVTASRRTKHNRSANLTIIFQTVAKAARGISYIPEG